MAVRSDLTVFVRLLRRGLTLTLTFAFDFRGPGRSPEGLEGGSGGGGFASPPDKGQSLAAVADPAGVPGGGSRRAFTPPGACHQCFPLGGVARGVHAVD